MKHKKLIAGVFVIQSACAVSGITEPTEVVEAGVMARFPDARTPDAPSEPVARDDAGGMLSSQPDAAVTASSEDASVPPAPVALPVVPVGGKPGAPSGSRCDASVCNDGPSGAGATCEQAISIGRATLLNGSPEYVNSTATSGANQDLTISNCKDEGNDVFYRVYLYPGEVINLSVRNRTNDRDLSVKFYFAGDCSPPTQAVCVDQGAKNLSELLYEQAALGEGWHYIVVDGPAGPGGEFSLSKTAPLATVANACSC